MSRVPRLRRVTPVLGALVLAGCGNLGTPDSASREGDEIVALWRPFVIIALCIAALIWGLVGWSVIRYRRRDDSIPGQRQSNIPLEVVYTGVPIVIVAVFFVFTLVVQDRVVGASADPDLTVDVTGFQWSWQFDYEDEGITVTGLPDDPPELVVPVDSTVRLNLRTEDVIHSIWVPEFLGKLDLIPRVDNELDVEVPEEGTWTGRCAEFCGLDHWRMSFTVRAVRQDEFEAWLEEAAAAEQPIVGTLEAGS